MTKVAQAGRHRALVCTLWEHDSCTERSSTPCSHKTCHLHMKHTQLNNSSSHYFQCALLKKRILPDFYLCVCVYASKQQLPNKISKVWKVKWHELNKVQAPTTNSTFACSTNIFYDPMIVDKGHYLTFGHLDGIEKDIHLVSKELFSVCCFVRLLSYYKQTFIQLTKKY